MNPEHQLHISSQWSRSHSGQDWFGDCSCGQWSTSHGGSPMNWRHIIRTEHAEHVAQTEASERVA